MGPRFCLGGVFKKTARNLHTPLRHFGCELACFSQKCSRRARSRWWASGGSACARPSPLRPPASRSSGVTCTLPTSIPSTSELCAPRSPTWRRCSKRRRACMRHAVWSDAWPSRTSCSSSWPRRPASASMCTTAARSAMCSRTLLRCIPRISTLSWAARSSPATSAPWARSCSSRAKAARSRTTPSLSRRAASSPACRRPTLSSSARARPRQAIGCRRSTRRARATRQRSAACRLRPPSSQSSHWCAERFARSLSARTLVRAQQHMRCSACAPCQ